MQTFSEFFAKKLEENQAPAQQPPRPGTPAAPSPPMNPAKKQQMLKDLSVAATNAANGVLAKHGIK